MADENNITTLAKRLRPFIKLAAQEMVPVTAYDHGALSGLSDDDHTQYMANATARTITAQHSFAPATAQAPFTLGANAQGQLVTGLYADQLSKGVTAGAGLTGGGALTADRTLAVGAGLGLTVNADDVALTTPGTLTVSSTNSSTGSHTHAVTSSSNPGAAASLLASDDSGYLSLVKLNTDTLADRSGGNLTVSPIGDIVFDPTGNDLYPNTNYDLNLGLINKKFLTLHAAELWVETLVAQNTIATIGGRILVGPTTVLTTDFDAAATSMKTKHNQMGLDDIGYLEADSKVEFIKISGLALTGANSETDSFTLSGDYTDVFFAGLSFFVDGTDSANDGTWTVESSSYATGTTTIVTVEDITVDTYTHGAIIWYHTAGDDAYLYPVITRNLDGTGANDWYGGDAIFNTGGTGNGFIDLYSVRGIKAASEEGPTVVGNVRASITYNDWGPRWAIGNLNGLYGYSSDLYGAAFGQYASGKANVTIDETDGFRLRSYTDTILQIKNTDGKGYFVGPMYLDTGGGIYQGSGTFASPTTGLKIWNDSGVGRIGGYNGGTVQWYADTDGKLYAGAGNVLLDADGLVVQTPAGFGSVNAYKFKYSATELGGLYGAHSSIDGINYMKLEMPEIASYSSVMYIRADSNLGSILYLDAYYQGSPRSRITLNGADTVANSVMSLSSGYIDTDCDIRIGGGLHVGAIDVDPAAGIVTIETNDALETTNARGLILQHNTTGTPGASFGNQIHFQLESTTTENRDAATIAVEWATATDASRAGRLQLYARDYGGLREGFRVQGSGTATLIGFYGATAIAKPTVTGSRGANAALASLLTALANLGLLIDSSS